MLPKVTSQVHLDGTPTGNNTLRAGQGATHNHDCIMQGTVHLSNELLSTSPQDERAGLGGGTASHKIEALIPHLTFLEACTGTQTGFG